MNPKSAVLSIIRRAKYYASWITAQKYLREDSHKPINDRRIKVGFIVQMPEIWDKEAPVFEQMLKDDRFDVFLIVVPSYDFVKSETRDYGSELAFFSGRYGTDRIILARRNNTWIDLEPLCFDYVFLQRCYENYLPIQYHTSTLIRFAKTCYIPYCYHALDDGKQYYMNSFFANLYLFYCCSEQQQRNQRPHGHAKTVYLGYPALETVRNHSLSENRSVLWTPRWADDKETGGSNFLKHMDTIPGLIDAVHGIQLTFRPHPMAFDNAVRIGAMTETQVLEYKKRIQDKGISFDNNVYVEDTFNQTDILITDFSSIVITYMLSGKPIIYCSNTDVRFSESYKRIIECSYIAKDYSDIEKYTKMLVNGIDPLKQKRIGLAEELRKEHNNSTNRIMEYLFADANMRGAEK